MSRVRVSERDSVLWSLLQSLVFGSAPPASICKPGYSTWVDDIKGVHSSPSFVCSVNGTFEDVCIPTLAWEVIGDAPAPPRSFRSKWRQDATLAARGFALLISFLSWHTQKIVMKTVPCEAGPRIWLVGQKMSWSEQQLAVFGIRELGARTLCPSWCRRRRHGTRLAVFVVFSARAARLL